MGEYWMPRNPYLRIITTFRRLRLFIQNRLLQFISPVAMIIGIVIVCLTVPQVPDKTCDFMFQRIAERINDPESIPRSVAVGDFNGDARLDITVANSGSDNVHIFLTFNNQTFESQHVYSTGPGSRPCSITVADFNNDRRLDIAVANFGTNSIQVLRGHGDGTFENRAVISLGSSRPLSIAFGDCNTDSWMDIVVANYGTDSITILYGNQDGSFDVLISYETGFDSFPSFIAVTDFNNDRHLDIVVTHAGTNSVGIFLGYGNGNFSEQHLYYMNPKSSPRAIAIADFNDDHRSDLAIANHGDKTIAIFLATENGTFTTKPLITRCTYSPVYIAVADFNSDQQSDIVVAHADDDSIGILIGRGNGIFTVQPPISTGYKSYPCSIAIADFNNDSRPDLVSINAGSGTFDIFVEYGRKPFANQTSYSTNPDSNPYYFAIGDLNNDNQSDIVVANFGLDSVGILLGDGTGSFGNVTTYSTTEGSSPTWVALADLNNDHQLDVVAANVFSDNIAILFGNGDGSLRSPITYSTEIGSFPISVAINDLNSDGYLDIVVANSGSNNIGIFYGYENGLFRNQTTYLTGSDSSPQAVVIADINKDHLFDIIVANTGDNTLGILMNNGDGQFKKFVKYYIGSGSYPTAVTVEDLNNDTRVDIVVANTHGSSISVFFGNGNGTFENQIRYSSGTASNPQSVAIVDVNNDGPVDIVIANALTDYVGVGILYGLGNGSFGNLTVFPTGSKSSPHAISLTDLNSDNRIDIVVANTDSDEIGVLIGNYDNEFSYKLTYATGSTSAPHSIIAADFNNDSWPDVVVANYGTNNIEIFLGDGSGLFRMKSRYSTGSGSRPQFVTVNHFNDDHKLDLAVANSDQDNIGIFYGHGDGTFETPETYWTGDGSIPYAITVGDFNNDKWPDMVVANAGTDSIAVFLGLDYATFEQQKLSPAQSRSSPYSMIVADFNNDHQLDVALAQSDTGNIGVLFGDGTGFFGNLTTYPVGIGSSPKSIIAGDFNNDHRLDIAVANYLGDNISVLFGAENGSFKNHSKYSTGSSSHPHSIAMADFNKDNRLDLVVANSNTDNVGVFLGNSNGSFQRQITSSTGSNSSPRSVAVEDFNKDTILDVVVANAYTDNIGVLLGYGNGSFGRPKTYSTGFDSYPQAVATGDFDHDTHLDIVVANYLDDSVGIFFGRANGSFGKQVKYSIGTRARPTSVVLIDLNNDHQLDIIVTNSGIDNIGILFGFRDGRFSAIVTYSSGDSSHPTFAAVADFNNDHQLDILVSNSGTYDIGIFLQNGTRLFQNHTTYPTGIDSSPYAVALGDFNNDSRTDIAVANYGAHNIGVFLGLGNGLFSKQKLFSTGNGSYPRSIVIHDLNQDTYMDMVVALSGTESVGIFFGDGMGLFTHQTIYSIGDGSSPFCVVVEDFDRDNRLDIAVSNFGNNNVVLLFADGNGTFTRRNKYAMGYGSHPYALTTSDFDKDNWIDIAIVSSGADKIAILWKKCQL